MTRQKEKRILHYWIIVAILLCSVILLVLCNLGIGSVSIHAKDVVKCLTSGTVDDTVQGIVRDIRLPRTLAALILGGALALSGYLLQTFFHNPIAGPFVLGISSGSKLTVSLVMVFLLGKAVSISSAALIGAAFVGAMLSMGFVLLMSKRVSSMSRLVVCGVMIGYICSAITDFVVTFADDADIVNLHNWSRGSFSGMAWGNLPAMAAVVFVAAGSVFVLSKPIGAYQLGESYAKQMGVNLRGIRILLILLSSILSACVVAYAGPISFVGIAVPQLTKQMLGTNKPIFMIPACFLGGSVFCLLCDLIARTVFAPTELAISTVTAVFGAPVVLWVMATRKKSNP
ncbi:MAG: iron ABC transporter permease [Lachnospiraceae bacterium]|nr:iron ABC transporter permease [Lachnospiraceae bacterium]